MTFQGRRRYDDVEPYQYEPGDYGLHEGHWYACSPNGLLAFLKNHHVEEHPDATISVLSGPWGSNSILVSNGMGNKSWHGYIRQGVWEEC